MSSIAGNTNSWLAVQYPFRRLISVSYCQEYKLLSCGTVSLQPSDILSVSFIVRNTNSWLAVQYPFRRFIRAIYRREHKLLACELRCSIPSGVLLVPSIAGNTNSWLAVREFYRHLLSPLASTSFMCSPSQYAILSEIAVL